MLNATYRHGLTANDKSLIQAVIERMLGDWTVDLVADGDATAAVLIPAEGDRFGPSFIVNRVDARRVEVSALRWDVSGVVGAWGTMHEALSEVVTIIKTMASIAGPRVLN